MDWKKFYEKHGDMLIGFLVMSAIYLAQAALRPLAAPWEYDFIVTLQEHFPGYPDNRFLLRLPSVMASLAGGVVMMHLAALCRIKRPGMTAVWYLLFPLTLYTGTAASGIPFLLLGVLIGVAGALKSAFSPVFSKRAAATVSALPGILLATFYVKSGFCRNSDFFMLLIPLGVLICGKLFSMVEVSDKERFCRLFNRLVLIFAGLLAALGVIIVVPAILRHFKVDFPPKLALYHAGERIFRPMLLVFLPMLWLYLAKEAKKCSKKLLLAAGALGFFVFTLPMTLPWNIQRNVYISYPFERIGKDISRDNTVCFVSASNASFFKKYFTLPVQVYGEKEIDLTPEQMKSKVAEKLKKHNVIVICTRRNEENCAPHFPGKRYVVGKFRMFYYYMNGVGK